MRNTEGIPKRVINLEGFRARLCSNLFFIFLLVGVPGIEYLLRQKKYYLAQAITCADPSCLKVS